MAVAYPLSSKVMSENGGTASAPAAIGAAAGRAAAAERETRHDLAASHRRARKEHCEAPARFERAARRLDLSLHVTPPS